MASAKRSQKLKDDADDFLKEFLKESPKTKKTLKRTKNEPTVEDSSARKKKTEASSERNAFSREKILNLVNNQLEARKRCNENFLNKLAEVTAQAEADYNAMKANEQTLQQLTVSFLKTIQQSSNANKQKLDALQEIQVSFKNKCAALETDHRAETAKVIDELQYDIESLQEKLISETKRSGWESLRRSIFHAMQTDL